MENRRITDNSAGISVFIIIGIILSILILLFLAVSAEADSAPEIKDFQIIKDGDNLNLSFSFFNVKGGLAEATFTVGYIVERDGATIEKNAISNLAIVSDLVKVSKSKKIDIPEMGKFQVIIPWFRAKDIKDILKSGDKIQYFIYLKDNQGRKSNTIFYEYIYIEKWNI
jgi:hypothetical protein